MISSIFVIINNIFFIFILDYELFQDFHIFYPLITVPVGPLPLPTGTYREPAAGTNFCRDLVGAYLIGTYLIGTNLIGYITYIGEPANL